MLSAVHDAAALRARFRLDIARLRQSATKLRTVDGDLRALKHRLERRAAELRDEAGSASEHHLDDTPGPVSRLPIRMAQAQATAELARRAALGELLRHANALALVCTMAVSRWIEAIERPPGEGARSESRRQALAKGHIDAGRVAHRTLAMLRRGRGLESGCGQLVCALVVSEIAPPGLERYLDEQIEEGFARASRSRGDEAVYAAVSAALREGARLLESMAERAGPGASELLRQADDIEARVEADLLAR